MTIFNFSSLLPSIVQVPDFHYIELFPAPLIIPTPPIIILLSHFQLPDYSHPHVYSALECTIQQIERKITKVLKLFYHKPFDAVKETLHAMNFRLHLKRYPSYSFFQKLKYAVCISATVQRCLMLHDVKQITPNKWNNN